MPLVELCCMKRVPKDLEPSPPEENQAERDGELGVEPRKNNT